MIIGENTADQTATWTSGRVQELDLTASSISVASASVAPGDAPPVDLPSAGFALDCSAGPGGTVTVTLHTTAFADPPAVAVISQFWEVASDFDGAFACDLIFTYAESALNGAAEGDIAGAARWDEGDVLWSYLGGTVSTVANTVTVADVTSFSPWLLLTDTPPQAVVDLGGNRSGTDAVLAWPAVTADIQGTALTPDHYVVYRRVGDPYFTPGVGDAIATVTTPGYTDVGALVDPAVASYYVVTAVGADGTESAPSLRLGAYGFPLVPGAGPGERAYNLVGLPVAVPGVTHADALAGYVGGGVYMVLRHDAPAQSVVWRLPGLAGENFGLAVGDAPYLYLEETAADALWLLGGVPSKGAVQYALARPDPGGSCAYNFVTLPLDRDDLVDADGLAADVGGVYMVARYNAGTQDLTWRLPGVAGVNFSVQAGHPYILCVDETAPAVWP